jgi:hypothetical protein
MSATVPSAAATSDRQEHLRTGHGRTRKCIASKAEPEQQPRKKQTLAIASSQNDKDPARFVRVCTASEILSPAKVVKLAATGKIRGQQPPRPFHKMLYLQAAAAPIYCAK